jgi:peptide/nickel transport system substrate-binding protein
VTTLALPLRNSTYTRNILNEVHEMLVRRDWETWEFKGVLAKGWDTEDTLVLKEDERLFGKLTDLGEHWLVTPVSPSHPLTSPRRVKKADTESIELGTVLTFHLREDVKWHDGHAFDAGDVVFSWDIYNNPEIKCDSYRSNFQKIERADRIDDYTVRFHYTEQYHKALDLFRNMACLPSHLYNLLDSDHPDHDPKADEAALAEAVNENPHNSNWIGLGPYRIVSADPKLHVAERFEDYFDPENAGWVDRIRWRHIAGWDTALEALKNGELDYSAWLSSDMYFGEVTSDQRFTDNFYKGKYTTGSVAFTAWNMRRPHLSDVRVRKALCHAFDMEAYRTQQCKGLGVIPTGTQATFSPAYNRDVLPLKYDPEKAIGLLAEAGWYDRDGDGVADKDGVPLQIKYLAQANHKGDAKFTELLKQSYDKIGVDLQVTAIDFSTIIQRLKARDFDAVSSSWSLPLESNQNQLWHSENDQPGRENYSGVRDPKVDAWLEQGDREIDTEKRYAIWKEMQRYLYEDVQPYLFRNTPPKRFAMNKKFRGFQAFALVPGYSVRRWYLAE